MRNASAESQIGQKIRSLQQMVIYETFQNLGHSAEKLKGSIVGDTRTIT